MQRQRTFKEYRAIDLGMLAILLTLFEFIIVSAAKWWFPNELYSVSLAAALTAIVYMRWGYWGGLHAALAGFIYAFFSGGVLGQLLIYTAGNLLSLLAVPLLLRLGKERVRTSVALSLLLAFLVLLLMQAGRAAVALLLGAAPADVVGFFTTDSLSYVFTLVIIWIARKLDGVYEDQKHYLLRINTEQE